VKCTLVELVLAGSLGARVGGFYTMELGEGESIHPVFLVVVRTFFSKHRTTVVAISITLGFLSNK
jgi:hypothetical protein